MRRTRMRTRILPALALAIAAVAAAPASVRAQLAHASASTLALSDNTTAHARAFGAISVNPAGLGMPGSGFSLALVPVQARVGLAPVTRADLVEYEGVVVPTAVVEDWLGAIDAAGGQSGTAGADVSELALTIGRFGLQISTTASTRFNIPAGVAEAYMLGNAGRTGEVTDLDLAGLGIDAFATTTGALAYAFPIGRAMFGVTGKYTMGHALGVARATSGSVSTDPIRVSLETPVIGPCDDQLLGSCTESLGNTGSGFGLDLGFMMELPMITVGASVIDAVNTFSWDVSTLSYRPGTALVEQGTAESDFDEVQYDLAPEDLRAIVEDYKFRPTVRLGAAMDLPAALTVMGDVHYRLKEEALAVGPRSHLGLGAEWRGIPFLHLRAGGALVSGGTQYSGGASLVLGPVNLSAAAAVRDADLLGETVLAQFTLSFGNR